MATNIVFETRVVCRCGSMHVHKDNNKFLSIEPVARVSEGVEMSEEPESMGDRRAGTSLCGVGVVARARATDPRTEP